jgi:CRP-like cAMP-binding protein
MKNFDLMENQPALVSSSYLYVPKEQEIPEFKDNSISVLSNIPEAGLTDLMKKGKAVKYVKQENITLNVNANLFFIVFYGKVTVTSKESGKETVCQIHESSTEFGEIALLTDNLTSVSAIILEKTVFGSISKTDFNNWLINYSDLEFKFLPMLSEKLDS